MEKPPRTSRTTTIHGTHRPTCRIPWQTKIIYKPAGRIVAFHHSFLAAAYRQVLLFDRQWTCAETEAREKQLLAMESQ